VPPDQPPLAGLFLVPIAAQAKLVSHVRLRNEVGARMCERVHRRGAARLGPARSVKYENRKRGRWASRRRPGRGRPCLSLLPSCRETCFDARTGIWAAFGARFNRELVYFTACLFFFFFPEPPVYGHTYKRPKSPPCTRAARTKTLTPTHTHETHTAARPTPWPPPCRPPWPQEAGGKAGSLPWTQL
jgi:hypothetical protein